jgi:hypothetical protein
MVVCVITLRGVRLCAVPGWQETKSPERQEGIENAYSELPWFRPLDYTNGNDGQSNRMA